MSANRITTRSLWETSGGNTRLKTADDVDFQKYKAIAMACDSGATLPTTPATGQWFLHTPTGRQVLMMYNGSSWSPLCSLGTMTLYVSTTGTDTQNGGFGAGTDAFLTIQYAVDQIPGNNFGNVTINVGTGTFTEDVTITGKSFSGNYTLTIAGTLSSLESVTSATVSAGSGATQGTSTKAGQYAGNSYANKMVYFVTDAVYRIIDSHTDDVLTLVGTAASSTSQNLTIYDWGTIIAGRISLTAQVGIAVQDISFSGFTSFMSIASVSAIAFTRCSFSAPTASIIAVANAYSVMTFTICVLIQDENQTTVISQNGSLTRTDYTKIVQSGATAGIGIQTTTAASLTFASGSIIDKFTTGIDSLRNGVTTMINLSASGYVRIRNCTTGLTAATGAQVTLTTNNQYSGNTANETATAASYGYID